MIRKILRKQKIKNANFFVEPDEIFLDSKNIQNFDRQQFEGRIEKPISKKNILITGGLFLFFIFIFVSRLFYLQINKGEAYLNRSQNNTLEKQLIFSDRGIIYDRNKKELAWNERETSDQTFLENNKEVLVTFPTRKYLTPGFSHLLGYVSYPTEDKSGHFWQTDFIGKDGLEKQYNDLLKGENGSKIVETDALKEVHFENIINLPKRGTDLITSIDSKIQKELFEAIKNFSIEYNYLGGAGVIMDVKNGEVLATTSYPEYNSEILSLGENSKEIQNYFSDKRKIFLDRTISGLYTPGSIVKPFLAVGALTENIISPNKQILSTGSISIPNPYFPGQETIFKDWKAHGWVDMRKAIAVSSDVYFYEIGGGFQDQKGMGISNIQKYSELFGIGQETKIDLPDEKNGVIPSPEWKLKNFNGDIWRVGDTYHTAIGQYGFQVTPLEMVRATAALANDGILLRPHLLLADSEKETEKKLLQLNPEYLKIAREGMRLAVSEGTATLLNVPFVKIAAKTGTAQVGISKNKINSWVIGFFPYENPRYAFAVMMEAGPSSNQTGATWIMRQLFDYMNLNTPEYLK